MVNFAKEVGNRKYYLQWHLFKERNNDGSFHIPEDWQHHVVSATFFFTGESVCFLSIICLFNSGLLCQTHVKLTSKHFSATKTYFSEYVRHSSVNFAWFAILGRKKSDDRPLFKSDKLPFRIALKQIVLEIIFTINQFQTMQNLYLWKRNSKKKKKNKSLSYILFAWY